jgi:hypothetical protein
VRDEAATGERKEEENMKTLAFVALVALLTAGAPAYAQMAIPDQSKGIATPMTETTVDGVITGIDLANRTLTLQDGERFTLPQSVAETSTPEVGEQVEVTYDVEGGQNVVREIGMGFGGTNG